MRLNVFIFVLLLGIYATLCIIKNGERLDVIIGEVQQCDTLMGGTLEAMSHATIKTESGELCYRNIEKLCRRPNH